MTATTLRAAATRLRNLGTKSARALAVAEVGCPECRQRAGARCRTPGFSVREPHKARVEVGSTLRMAFGLIVPCELVADLLDLTASLLEQGFDPNAETAAALNLARAVLGSTEGDQL